MGRGLGTNTLEFQTPPEKPLIGYVPCRRTPKAIVMAAIITQNAYPTYMKF